MILLFGAVLAALGLFSGAVLVAVALGLVAWEAGAMLWILFPLFSISGYALMGAGAREAQLRLPTLAISAVLIVLAIASAIGIVLSAAAVVSMAGSTLALWYVLIVAGSLGAIGIGSYGRAQA